MGAAAASLRHWSASVHTILCLFAHAVSYGAERHEHYMEVRRILSILSETGRHCVCEDQASGYLAKRREWKKCNILMGRTEAL